MNDKRRDYLLAHPPTAEQVELEYRRQKYNRRYSQVLRSTIYTLITVAAIAILVATLWLPVLQIYGSSMTPTMQEGDIVLSFKSGTFEPGDLLAFYYNNKVLVKRVIAGPGQWVNILEDGTVLVDGNTLEEPYLQEKALGDCNIELPYQVPDGRYFVMGDLRDTSVDSRNTAIGPIASEQVVGRIRFRVWPLNAFGPLN